MLRETDLPCSNPELRNHLSSFGRRNSEDSLTRSSLTDRISVPECFQEAAQRKWQSIVSSIQGRDAGQQQILLLVDML